MIIPRGPKLLALPAAVGVVLGLQSGAQADHLRGQPDPCSGDQALYALLNRPVGSSACAVPRSSTIIETGYDSEVASSSEQNASYPQASVRYGLMRHLEINVLAPSYQRQHIDGIAPTSGFGDFGAGVKFELGHSARTALGIDADLTVPSGKRAFSSGLPTATFNFNFAYSLSPNIGISGTFGMNSSSSISTENVPLRFFAANPAVGISDQLGHGFALFGDVSATTSTALGHRGKVSLDGGLQRLISPNIEIDLEVGRSASSESTSHVFGLGAGFLL